MEVQTEVTLRSIFGDDFTEDLVKEIIVQNKERKKTRKEIVNQPVFVPEQPEDPILTPPLPTFVEINNNNNLNHTISCEDNTFGELKPFKKIILSLYSVYDFQMLTP